MVATKLLVALLSLRTMLLQPTSTNACSPKLFGHSVRASERAKRVPKRHAVSVHDPNGVTQLHKYKNSPSLCEQGEFVFIVCILLQDYFNQRSSQLKKRRCQSTLFCGWSTQWFSSGKINNSAGMPRSLAAL